MSESLHIDTPTGSELTVSGIAIKGTPVNNEIKPYEIFAAMSGYVVPTKDAFLKTELDGDANAAQELTFKTLKAISEKKNDYNAFDNPVDDTTGSFRKRLETALGTEYTASKADAHIMTAKELYETMS